MKKKLQVFISSTFSDLRKERQDAVESILTLGHIPAGMELFTANNQSQLDVIKKWIEESDIFMLILGGRYGSIEPNSQKSYTELEYDYAISKNKPFFALIIHEDYLNEKVKTEGICVIETENVEKLKKFKEKVLSKLSSFFNKEDIKYKITTSINNFTSNPEFNFKGWIRAEDINNDTLETMKWINEMSKENKIELEKQMKMINELKEEVKKPKPAVWG